MKATLESGTSLIHLRAQIDGQTSGSGSVTQDGTTITLHSGYPTGYWQNSMRYIAGLDTVDWSATNDTVCTGDWCGKGNQTYLSSGITTTSPVVIGKVFPEGYSYNDECGVYYINYLNGARPVVGLETADCD
ncbi:hypothetical protein F0521_18360 [Ferrimonas sp. YFM]|nr:hypothetical protein F0521_18360 [Ferrimonas sp. YFM]